MPGPGTRVDAQDHLLAPGHAGQRLAEPFGRAREAIAELGVVGREGAEARGEHRVRRVREPTDDGVVAA